MPAHNCNMERSNIKPPKH